MRQGARIGFSGPVAARPAKNLMFALENPQFMDNSIAALLSNQQIHSPFCTSPLPAFCTSPLGSVTHKRNPNKRRLINHLSWPKGASVNNGIPDSKVHIVYKMFEHAVDDLKLSGPGSLMGLGRALGLCFQDSKTVWLSTCIDFLGLKLDSVAMEAQFPPDKLQYLRELLHAWGHKTSATLHKIQELTGFLQFCSQVIPQSCTYIRRLIDFSMKFNSPIQVLCIPAGAQADIGWWSIFYSIWNGVRILANDMPSLQVFTDASGTKGLGGLFGNYWFSSRIPHCFCGEDIQFKETYAVLRAILCWGDLWDGAHVNFNVDNQAVVAWLNSGSGKSPRSMMILWMISMLAAFLNFSFSSSWISTVDNAIADAASCFQYSKLFQLAGHLPRTSSSMKSPIIGIKCILASFNARHSIYGMGLQQALAVPTLRASNLISIS